MALYRCVRYIFLDGKVILTSPCIERPTARAAFCILAAIELGEFANRYIMQLCGDGSSWRFLAVITASGLFNFTTSRRIIADRPFYQKLIIAFSSFYARALSNCTKRGIVNLYSYGETIRMLLILRGVVFYNYFRNGRLRLNYNFYVIDSQSVGDMGLRFRDMMPPYPKNGDRSDYVATTLDYTVIREVCKNTIDRIVGDGPYDAEDTKCAADYIRELACRISPMYTSGRGSVRSCGRLAGGVARGVYRPSSRGNYTAPDNSQVIYNCKWRRIPLFTPLSVAREVYNWCVIPSELLPRRLSQQERRRRRICATAHGGWKKAQDFTHIESHDPRLVTTVSTTTPRWHCARTLNRTGGILRIRRTESTKLWKRWSVGAWELLLPRMRRLNSRLVDYRTLAQVGYVSGIRFTDVFCAWGERIAFIAMAIGGLFADS